MKELDPHIASKLNLQTCYIQIGTTARNSLDAGHLHIWIYYSKGRLVFHYVELKNWHDNFVAHFRCDKIVKGLAGKTWNQIGSRIARLAEKDGTL